MGARLFACLALTGACVAGIPGVSRPSVTTGGTWSCQQIVEQCDAACESASCLDGCTANGTPQAQQQHNAVVSCGQRSFCTDEDCMRANCSTEMERCAAEAQTTPAGDPPPP